MTFKKKIPWVAMEVKSDLSVIKRSLKICCLLPLLLEFLGVSFFLSTISCALLSTAWQFFFLKKFLAELPIMVRNLDYDTTSCYLSAF